MGMGNPLLDISADVEQAMLDKYEVTLNNAILAEEKHMPVFQDLVDNFKDVQYIAGGATMNSIRVAQWMMQHEKATSFFGCVGKDAFGKQLRECTEADGVTVHFQEDEKTPTGTCACLILKHERSLIANVSAANEYTLDHLKEEANLAVFDKAKFVYIAGFFLTVKPERIAFVGSECQAKGKTFAMNLSAPFIPQFFGDALLEAVKNVDILFGNESEAEALATAQKWEDCDTTEKRAIKAQALPMNGDKKRMVVFTQGAGDTIVVDADGKATSFPVPPLTEEQIVDANGAGDAFVGGFLAKLVEGKPVADCVAAGNYAASVVLGVSGTKLSGKPDMK
jgi:adenosine kinase